MKGFISTKEVGPSEMQRSSTIVGHQETSGPLTKEAVSFSLFYKLKATEEQKQGWFVIRQVADINLQFPGSQGTYTTINHCTPQCYWKDIGRYVTS